MTPASELMPVRDGSEGAPPPSAPPAPPAQPDSLESIRADIRTPQAAAPATAPAPIVEPAPQPTVVPEPAVAAPTPEAPVPIPEPVITEAPAPESWLAPLFTLGNDDAAIDQAQAIVEDLALKDPVAHGNLLHGVYYANEKKLQSFALQRLGVSADKVQEFVAWAKTGQPLVAPTVSTETFPVPSAEGYVKLPSGREIDTTTAEGAELYDLAKFQFEQRNAEAVRQAQETKANQEAEQRLEQSWQTFSGNCLDECATTYMDARAKLVTDLITPAIANLQGDDVVLGEMFQVYAQQEAAKAASSFGNEASRDLEAIIQDAVSRGRMTGLRVEQIKASCLDRIKQGKMLTHAANQDRVIKTTVNSLKDKFSRMILSRNRAEIAATVTDPVLPQGTRTVTAEAPPQADLSNVTTLEDLRREAQAADRRNAQALRQRQ